MSDFVSKKCRGKNRVTSLLEIKQNKTIETTSTCFVDHTIREKIRHCKRERLCIDLVCLFLYKVVYVKVSTPT